MFFFCRLGAEDYAPLPESIIQGKTVYIVNQSDLATVADSAYSELKKWKRFRVVDSKGEADLVFVFTPISKGTQGAVGAVVNIGGMPVAVGRGVEGGETQFAILDAKAGEKLWANTKPWSSSGSTRDLIRDLRKRIEKQERAKKEQKPR